MFALLVVATPAHADLGDCGQPLTAGPAPLASDCLFILQATVGIRDCAPRCMCAPGGSLPVTATDALTCMSGVVGASAVSGCPCSNPFWFPVELDGATDLGHEPRELAPGEREAAGGVAFEDATDAAGLAGLVSGGNTHGVGVAFVDLDGDGWEDIVVVNGQLSGGGPLLGSAVYTNDGDGTFTDATVSSGVGAALAGADGYSVAAADYDADGDVDLYVGAHPGDVLLQNQGDGTFLDRTAQAGAGGPASAQSGSGSKIVSFGDMDSDGLPDLVSASSDLPDAGLYLLRNLGDGTFADATAGSGAAIEGSGNPCAVLWTDYDNDGTFTNVTHSAGTAGDFGWGLGFEDFNADTHPDIFVAQEDNLSFLAFTNEGELPLSFTRADIPHIAVLSTSRAHNVAVAFVDYDHDGRTDVLTATTDGSRVSLFRNVTERGSNAWLEVAVSRAPGGGPAGGVTARVFVKTGTLVQFREVYGGSSRASQNALTARFGLGNWTGADYVAVQWPDGAQSVVTGVPGNQRIAVP